MRNNLRKIFYIIFILIIGWKRGFAQNKCNLSLHIVNSNLYDTVFVKGTIRSIVRRFGDDPRLTYLESQQKLNLKNINCSVEFKIEDCKNYNNFYYEIEQKSKVKMITYLNGFQQSQKFIFTCVIFNDKNIPKGYIKDKPFVIIKKIEKVE